MSGDGRAPSRSERVYRAMLKAYPREFREQYGPQMAQTFGDLFREASETGGFLVLVGLWMRTMLDLTKSVVAERGRANAGGASRKSPGAAALLSLLWWGLGQVYNGQKTKGWTLVLAGVVWAVVFNTMGSSGGSGDALAFGLVVLIAVQLWSAWDAYQFAKSTDPEEQIGQRR